MPGYANPVDSNLEGGVARSISYTVNQTSTPTLSLYTAASRTRVVSVLATNTYGTILPVTLYVNRDVDETIYPIAETRVLKSKYMVQQLVSGDSRVNDTADPEVGKYKVATDFVLNPSDTLMATCPIEDAITLTVSLKEGI